MAERPTLAACLIVRDEAENLPRCLASLQGQVDELVVVDTGSTDETVAIAQAHGATVGHFAWCDDFAAARNAALDLATAAWALVLDADEELVVKDAARLRKALATPDAAHLLRLVNVGPDGSPQSEKPDALRLFPLRDDVRFAGRLHEDVEPALRAAGLRLAPLGAAWIRHHGYVPAAMPAKAARNHRIAARAAADRPDDPLPWLFVAQAAWLARDAAGALAAVAAARGAIGAGGRMGPRQRVALALVEIWVRVARGEGLAADAALAEALAAEPDHPELRYERGRRRLEAGDAAGAADDLKACLRADAGRERFGPLRTGVTGFLAHTELMGLAAAQGDAGRAAKHALAAAADPDCPPAEAARFKALAAQLRGR